VKRFARCSAAAAVGAAILSMATTTASIGWSQSTRPSDSAAPATTQTQQQQEQQQPQQGGDREGRSGYRGYGDRRFEGRGDGMRPPRMEWRRGSSIPDGRPENFSEPTADEWKEIEAFMKTHSPERLARLEEVGDEQRQQGVRNMFAARYRALEELKQQDPEMYRIRVARMPIEDKVFDLGWKLTHARPNEKPDENKAKLRSQLRLLVQSRLEERALRLRHLEKRLADERQKLKDDEQRLEDLVNSNLSDIAEDRLPRDLRPQLTPRRERRNEDNPTDTNAAPADQ
jgi:hypothetical protein